MVSGRAGGGRPLRLSLLRAALAGCATTGSHGAALRVRRSALRGRACAVKTLVLGRLSRGQRSGGGLGKVVSPSGGRLTRRRQHAGVRSNTTVSRFPIRAGAVSGTARAKRGL